MNSRHDPSNNGTGWHLVEERIRADEREKVLGEVNGLYLCHTCGCDKLLLAKLNQLKGTE